MTSEKTIVIIPARGGSKGIPRKNLRPINGKPLIYYSITASLKAKNVDRVVISTEDEEIALFATRFGAEVIIRPDHLAGDDITIDPVISHAVQECQKKWDEKYKNIVTIQPTSPLLDNSDIEQVIDKLKNDSVETVISVCEDKHLRWSKKGSSISPEYHERVNRQFLPDVYKETGAIIACKKNVLKTGTRIGEKIGLHVIDSSRSIDIDSYNDLWLCELILKRKKIVISVIGDSTVGMGHVYRMLMLAHELIHHEIIFVCKKSDTLAKKFIAKYNYKIQVCPDEDFLETIISFKPNMVINDILDTNADFIVKLKKIIPYVINFEDMGTGAEVADLVINALYPHSFPQNHILVGPEFFCLRDEFLHITKRTRSLAVGKILISFGGVDEGNLTCRVLKLVANFVKDTKILVDVVLGPGYAHHHELDQLVQKIELQRINVIRSTTKISEFMNNADIAIVSAGRTVFELASLEVPTIVIAQNLRETHHTFASSSNGFINLGLRTQIDDQTISEVLLKIINDKELRKTMTEKMRLLDLTYGKKRVVEKINAFLR